MVFYSIFCLLAILLTVLSDCVPEDSQNLNGNCVHVENLQASWNESVNFCKSRNGNLVSIHNAFDMNTIQKLARSCDSFWIGGICESGNDCTWIDGSKFDYSNFRNNNPGSANCIMANTRSGKWSTENCESSSCIACEISGSMSNCQDWMNAGFTDSGKYTILLNGSQTEVYCDMSTYGGGWVVFQNRVDGTTRFWDRTWDEYKHGFGNDMTETTNFWLGNDALHLLTEQGNTTLRIEIHGDRTPNSTHSDDYWWGHYFQFTIGSESSNYPINLYMDWSNVVGNASSNWYDITYSSGAQFSTIDKINDQRKECVTQFEMGGWWLNNCALSTLNGAYIPKDWDNGYGMFWIVDGYDYIIHPVKSRMMLRKTI